MLFYSLTAKSFGVGGTRRISRAFLLCLHMEAKKQRSYEEAVYALNGLQSNAAYIRQAREGKNANPIQNLTDTEKHLETLGIKVDDLDSLNVIHISGTKGKGSTCAFTESILRYHKFKTGFYSSPHLVTVNERIRINGEPLKKDVFTLYFWHVYEALQSNLRNGEKLPSYFMFLTVMAFYVFMKEKVDVAIVEVGIGGLYDCTNVVRRPAVVGVTTLGLDHVHLLGNTIAKISEQKAGIFKPGVPAYTVSQPDGAIAVLQKRASTVGCLLEIAPPFEAYQLKTQSLTLGVPGEVQKLNASLALQLSKAWLKRRQSSEAAKENFMPLTSESSVPSNTSSVPVAQAFSIESAYSAGLQSCVWPGRFQTLHKGKFTFYLDGAHTLQSMKHCARWFRDFSHEEMAMLNSSSVCRILLFNCTGERKAESLLDPLSELQFDLVLFSPNRISMMKDASCDQSNFNVDPAAEMDQCFINQQVWCHFMRSFDENSVSIFSQASNTFHLDSIPQTKYCDPENTLLFTCLNGTLAWLIRSQFASDDCLSSKEECLRLKQVVKDAAHVQVLVTGSLHLVGNVLGTIDPNLHI